MKTVDAIYVNISKIISNVWQSPTVSVSDLVDPISKYVEEYSSEKDKEIERLQDVLLSEMGVRAGLEIMNETLTTQVVEAERKGWNEAIDKVLEKLDDFKGSILLDRIQKLKK